MIADFDRHHPRLLPSALSQFRVEECGVGADTVHSFRMKVGGRVRAFRMQVAEPDPGQVLTESDERSSMVTTWVVTPEGPGCRVRLETRWRVDWTPVVGPSDLKSTAFAALPHL